MASGPRHLITLAASEYDSPRLQRDGILESEERVVRVLRGFGYDHVLRMTPARQPAFEELAGWMRECRTLDGTLVVYVIAHAEFDDECGLTLLMRDHGSAAPRNTTISPKELAFEVARTPSYPRVLCIFDCCYAGAAEADMVAAAAHALRRESGSVDLVATTSAIAEAGVTSFSTALEAVLFDIQRDPERWAVLGPYLPLSELLYRLDGYLAGAQAPLGPLQRLRHGRAGGVAHANVGFFPNPHHDPDLPMQQTLEVENWLALSRSALRDHWLTRARGVPSGFGFGWYFQGRETVLASLENFLQAPQSDGKLRVITGSPGVGKSAVLAQLVARSRPELAARAHSAVAKTIPLAAALWARRKTLAALVEELATAAGIPLTEVRPHDRTEEFLNAVARRTEPLPILLDALDEATEPSTIARELLAKLAPLPCTRVVVGTRHEILAALGSACTEIDLDTDDATVALEAYTKARLLREHDPYLPSPYRGRPDLAGRVAGVVAERARPLFLVAQLVADALLLEHEPADPSDAAWVARLPRAADEAFSLYLDRVGSGSERERIVRSLLPLAYAQGEGLPRATLWPRLATKLSGELCTEADIDQSCRTAGAYIVHDRLDGEDVYRLYHEALADHLRTHARAAETAIHALITETLVSELPESSFGNRDFRAASAYARKHLATHAARAGILDSLLLDPRFLITAEPQQLLAALRTLERQTPEAAVYEHALHLLQKDRKRDAASYLQLSAHKLGARSLASQIDAMGLTGSWSVSWAIWQPERMHRLLEKVPVTALTLVNIDDSPVLIVGTTDGTLHLLDARTGHKSGNPLSGHHGCITCLASIEIDTHAYAVSGSKDRTLRLWNLRTGRSVGEPMHGHNGAITCVAATEVAGIPCALSGSSDNTLRLWNLRTQRAMSEPLRGHTDQVNCVAVADLDEETYALSASGDGTLRLWNLRTGLSISDAMHGHKGPVTCVAVVKIDGELYALSGSGDGTMRRWNLRTGLSVGDPLSGHSGPVTCLAVTEIAGELYVLSGSTDKTLQLWHWTTGQAADEPMRGHEADIVCLVAMDLDGRPCALSGSWDNTLRLWDLRHRGAFRESNRQQNGPVSSVAIVSVGNEVCALSGSNETLQLWNLQTGSPVGSPMLADRSSRITNLITLELDGEPFALSCSGDSAVGIWNLRTGKARFFGSNALDSVTSDYDVDFLTWLLRPLKRLRNYDHGVTCIARIAIDGVPHALLGLDNNELRLWNLHLNKAVGDLRASDEELQLGLGVTCLAVMELEGEPCAISGSADYALRLWSLRARRPIREPMRGHAGPVTCVATLNIDGNPYAISGSEDANLRVWNLRDGEVLGGPMFGHHAPITCLVVAQINREPYAFSGSEDKTLILWNLRSQREQLRIDLGSTIRAIDTCQVDGDSHVAVATDSGLLTLALPSVNKGVLGSEPDGRSDGGSAGLRHSAIIRMKKMVAALRKS